MNIYESGITPMFDQGRIVRIMAMGDSMTAGINAASGWRSPFKKILTAWGCSNWEFVGSKSDQTEDLGDFGRDWLHDGYGGYRVDQLTAIVRNRIQTYSPDLLVVLSGNNIAAGLTRAEAKTLYDGFYAEAFAAGNVQILSISRTPMLNGSAWSMDSNIAAMIQGHKDSCRTQQNAGRPVVHASAHDLLRVGWCPSWYVTGDSTHFNSIGNYRLGSAIAKQVYGQRYLDVTPDSTSVISSVASNLDFPYGAQVVKTNASDFISVVTWGGETVTIPAAWPTGVAWPAPIVRINQAGTTITGSLVVQTFRIGALI